MVTTTNDVQVLFKSFFDSVKNGDTEAANTAMKSIADEFKNRVAAEALSIVEDSQIKAARGQEVLTKKERKFFEGWIDSVKSGDTTGFETLVSQEGMPETIYQSVFDNIKKEHPLLSRVNFVYVSYLTKWLVNDSVSQLAAWGEIGSEIKEQIKGAFREISIVQSKLSAFLLIEKDYVELGPEWLRSYCVAILTEAIAYGLENGIINGSGANGEILGLVRDVHKGVLHNDETGWPKKTAVKVTTFLPREYDNLVAYHSKKESGETRIIPTIDLIVNPVDYIKKIMPATTALNQGTGQYITGVFPYPTNVIQSIAVEEGEAIMGIIDDYFLGVGNKEKDSIEESDEVCFLEDQRAYKAKLYAAGMPLDNTVAQLLDISELQDFFTFVAPKATPAADAQDNEEITA